MLNKKELDLKLSRFAHRAIKKGEIALLARLIADRLPVQGAAADSPGSISLTFRNEIDSVVYTLGEHMHISKESCTLIYSSVEQFWLWRRSICLGESNLIFSGEVDKIVDEVTGIKRFVFVDDLCAMTDIVNDLNYIYGIFKELVQVMWTQTGGTPNGSI